MASESIGGLDGGSAALTHNLNRHLNHFGKRQIKAEAGGASLDVHREMVSFENGSLIERQLRQSFVIVGQSANFLRPRRG